MTLIAAGTRELRAAPMVDATVTEMRGGNLRFEGYAAVYGVDSAPMAVRQGGQLRKFVERNEDGSFAGILARNPDVRMLGLNHDENHVLARTKSGTLDLASDRRGLKSSADLAPTTYAIELRSTIERGDVDAMSYGFNADPDLDRWDESDPMMARRSIGGYTNLWDVAPVTFPAFDATEASFRSLEVELRSGALSSRELRALLDVVEPLGAREESGGALSEHETRAGACPGCAGSGDCPSCAGTGKAGRQSRSARATQMDCAACYGTGTCQGCAGIGVTPNADGPDWPPGENYRAQAVKRETRRRLMAVTR